MPIYIDIPGIANQNPQNLRGMADGAATRRPLESEPGTRQASEGWSDSVSLNHGVEREVSSGPGRAAGSHAAGDVDVSHGVDRASPKLADDAVGVRGGLSAEHDALEGDPDRPRIDLEG